MKSRGDRDTMFRCGCMVANTSPESMPSACVPDYSLVVVVAAISDNMARVWLYQRSSSQKAVCQKGPRENATVLLLHASASNSHMRVGGVPVLIRVVRADPAVLLASDFVLVTHASGQRIHGVAGTGLFGRRTCRLMRQKATGMPCESVLGSVRWLVLVQRSRTSLCFSGHYMYPEMCSTPIGGHK